MLNGDKQLLQLGMVGGYDIRFFSKTNSCTKNYILSYFSGDEISKTFLPDDISLNSLDRGFLLSVLFNVKRDKYLTIYNYYKGICSERKKDKWTKYTDEFLKKLQQYSSVNGEKNNGKIMRLKKNGRVNALIKPRNENDLEEKLKPIFNYDDLFNGKLNENDIMDVLNEEN